MIVGDRLLECATLTANQKPVGAAESAADSVPSDTQDASALSAADFKAPVTIVAVEGDQISDHADVAMPAGSSVDGVAVVDPATSWLDGKTPLATPATLAAGQIVGLATTLAADGLNHVLFVDTAPSDAPDGGPTPVGQAAADGTARDDSSTQLPPSVVAASTGTSRATVTATDGTSVTLTLTLTSEDGSPTTATVDSTAVPFFAGDTRCTPGDIAIGTTLGAAYHLDGGNVIIDALMVDS